MSLRAVVGEVSLDVVEVGKVDVTRAVVVAVDVDAAAVVDVVDGLVAAGATFVDVEVVDAVVVVTVLELCVVTVWHGLCAVGRGVVVGIGCGGVDGGAL